jgi:signal transduction histidine kinase
MAVLYQSGVDYLQPSQPADSEAARVTTRTTEAPVSIAALRYASAIDRRRVSIRGTIVLRRPMLFVQDATGGIAIPVTNPERFTAGEEVEVSGIPVTGAFSIALREANVQILGPGKPLPPKSVTVSEAATGIYDGQYIELTGELRANDQNAPAPTLSIDADSQSFKAVLPDGSESASLLHLPMNGLIRVRGVEVVDPRYTRNLTPFVLLVSSSNAVELLADPPWWSLQNMVWFGPILVILILVSQMIRVHYRHIRIQAVVDERQRLGHELHDTLAQSFAGIGYQLQAIDSGLATGDRSICEHVNLAKEMVRHSHQEARLSIASMHPELMQSAPIAVALEKGARQMVQGTTLRVVANTTGEPKPLPPRIQDALFRIGQEAISNAVRHGLPGLLEILVAYQPRTIQLVIQDDGKGFDTAADLPGFGLRGMRRRADAIAAEFHVTSKPGQGVRIEARAHLKPEFSLATRFARRKRSRVTA